jgi:hypothetical protein
MRIDEEYIVSFSTACTLRLIAVDRETRRNYVLFATRLRWSTAFA